MTASESSGKKKTRRGRRRRWPWIVLGVLVLIAVLVALGPTIASTGPVRAMIVGRINATMNGTMSVEDWSLGWFSGIRIHGMKIDDDQGRRILEVARVDLPLGLLDALRGNYEIGEATIDRLTLVRLEIDEHGVSNYQKLFDVEPDDEPAELPRIRGRLTINELRGMVVSPHLVSPVHIEESSVMVHIPDINQPITNDITLAYRLGEAPSGTLAASGTIHAIHDDRVDLQRLVADQKVEFANAAMEPLGVLISPDGRIVLGGTGNGAVALNADGTGNASVQGSIEITEPVLSGDILQGDRFATRWLRMPVNVTRTVADDQRTVLRFEQLQIETEEAVAQVSGEVVEQALQRIARREAPGDEGTLSATVEVRDMRVANQLRNTLQLEQEVQFTGGRFVGRADLNISPQSVATNLQMDLEATGRRGDEDVALEPVHLTLAGMMLPTGEPLPELRDVALTFRSAFANAQGGGASLADLGISGNVDLARFRQQVAQFGYLREVEMAGTGEFEIASKGDLAQAGQTAQAQSSLEVRDLVVRGLIEGTDIVEPRLFGRANATLVRGTEKFFDAIRDVDVAAQTGPRESPVIDWSFTAASVSPAGDRIDDYTTNLAIADVPQAQERYGQMFPALNDIRVTEGALYAVAGGSIEGTRVTFTTPLEVSIRNLTAHRVLPEQQPADFLRREHLRVVLAGVVSLPEAGGIAGDLSQLELTTQSNLLNVRSEPQRDFAFAIAPTGAISGEGVVRVDSNLVALNNVVRAFGGEVRATTPTAGELTSGLLNANVTMQDAGQRGTALNIDGKITQLSVRTHQQPIENETVTLALSAITPQDLSGIVVEKGTVQSAFASTTITDAAVRLDAPTMWDMLQRATLDVTIPDLPRTYAVVSALAPPVETDEEPTEPLVVTSGDASAQIQLTRDVQRQTTRLQIPQLRATRVAIARGQQQFAFDPNQPIDLNLTTEITAADEIRDLRITQLAGQVSNVARAEMPEPIVITRLGDKPTAQGSISLVGAVEPTARMLAVLQGTDPRPYTGSYNVTQRVTTEAARIRLVGSGTITELRTAEGEQPQNVALNNDLLANFDTNSLEIRSLSLELPETRALAVSLTGRIDDWDTQRHLRDIKMTLAYDLARLWPLVEPMLSPEMREQLVDLEIAGQYERTFAISGSWPAGLEFHEAIPFVRASGSVGVERLYTGGATISYPELPILLENGQLVTVWADRPRAERHPAPGTFNEGAFDLGSIVVDMTQPVWRLSIGRNQRLIQGASINALLANNLGPYVSPIFPNSDEARGLLSVTVEEFDKVAIGPEFLTDREGRARVVFSLEEMRIINPVFGQILGSVLGEIGRVPAIGRLAPADAEALDGRITNAVITLADGRTTQDITLQLTEPARAPDAPPVVMPMTFRGDINLSDLTQSIQATIPTPLVARAIPIADVQRALHDIFPAGVPVSLRGTTSDPQIDAGNIAARVAEGILRARLLGRDRPEAPREEPGVQPDRERAPSPLDILDPLLRERERRRERDRENPDPAPAPEERRRR